MRQHLITGMCFILFTIVGALIVILYSQQKDADKESTRLSRNSLGHAQQIDVNNTDIFRLTKQYHKLSERIKKLQDQLADLYKMSRKRARRVEEVHRQQYDFFKKRCPKSMCSERNAFWYTSPSGGAYRCCYNR